MIIISQLQNELRNSVTSFAAQLRKNFFNIKKEMQYRPLLDNSKDAKNFSSS